MSNIDFEKLGRELYETAISHFHDKPCRSVVIPMSGKYGELMTIKAEQPLQVVLRDGLDTVTYYVLSDETLKEKYRIEGFYNEMV